MNSNSIKDLLNLSNLTRMQQNNFFGFVSKLDDQSKKKMYELIEENLDIMPALADILELKRKAIKNGDVNLWKKVLEKEKDLLNNMK